MGFTRGKQLNDYFAAAVVAQASTLWFTDDWGHKG